MSLFDPINSNPAPAIDSPTGGAFTGALTGGGAALGKDDFLQLLVAQLKNQDPLDPSAPEEFAAQLAQFSSLEQLINVNENLQASIQSNAAVSDTIVSTSSMGLLGREVMVPGSTLVVGEGAPAPITIGVGEGGGVATLNIYDEGGNRVADAELGVVGAGRNTIDISDHVSGLDQGRYSYEVAVTGDDGGPVEVQSLYRMRVEGVRFGPNGPELTDGVQTYSIADVTEIIDGR